MEKPKIVIEKSPNPKKKYMATINNKHVNFGAAGYSDYTIHKDPERKERYIKRHAKMGKDWSKNGYDTAGWMSRWVLWNQPTLKASIANANKRFNLDIKWKK